MSKPPELHIAQLLLRLQCSRGFWTLMAFRRNIMNVSMKDFNIPTRSMKSDLLRKLLSAIPRDQ
jgi:hypothetical protein